MTAYVTIARSGIFWRYYLQTSNGSIVQRSRRYATRAACMVVAKDVADYYDVPLVSNNMLKGGNNNGYGRDTATAELRTPADRAA